MGWSIGWDSNWKRDIGYGVTCECDHPDCDEKIHRGLAYVCGSEPYGGDCGCGLFFCEKHLTFHQTDEDCNAQLCKRCANDQAPFDPKPDLREWVEWKLEHHSWQQWRDENPDEVNMLTARIKALDAVAEC